MQRAWTPLRKKKAPLRGLSIALHFQAAHGAVNRATPPRVWGRSNADTLASQLLLMLFLSHPQGGEHRNPRVCGEDRTPDAGWIGYRYLLSHP